MIRSLPSELGNVVRESPLLSAVFADWDALELPDAWLVAGAVFQTFWNYRHGFEPGFGIADIDLIYFDGDDLSEATETAHYQRINAHFRALGVPFDVKNEARVHLWYEQHFGYAIPPYASAEAAMRTFPTTAGAIGLRPVGNKLEAFVPFGFDDLLNLVIRPNKQQITPSIYAAKVAKWQPKWPQVRYLDWDNH